MKFFANLPLFIQFSENEKRLFFVILLAIIVLLLLIGAIGYVIQRVMKFQGKKLDNYVYDAVVCRVITEDKHFKSYARRKNLQLFLKEAWIPLLIILSGIVVLIIKGSIDQKWDYNPFNRNDGFATLLWVWDFENPIYYNEFFGLKLLSKWPDALNNPHFVVEAWAGYLSVPCFIVGGIWYAIVVQGLFARWIRKHQLVKDTFGKDLSKYNVNTGFVKPNPPVQQQQPQQPQNPQQ